MADSHNPSEVSEQETRDLILDAARSAFQQRGTAGARMQEIADIAGVNKALLHYYFSTKEQLAAAVFHREAKQLLPPVMHVLGSDLELDQKVRRVVELYLGTLREAPNLPAYVLAEMHFHPERLREFVSSVIGTSPDALAILVLNKLREQIEAEVTAGRMRPIEPEQFLLNLVALCIFPFAARPMVMLILGLDDDGFAELIDRRTETLADFFLGALRP